MKRGAGAGTYERDTGFAAEKEAPCGCKWYANGTAYKCLTHRMSGAYDGWCGVHGYRNVEGCPGCPGHETAAAAARYAVSRRAWALHICTIAFVICGTVFRWWWPVVVLAALLLLIDAIHRLSDHLEADDAR